MISNILHTIFYSLAFVFIWTEAYHMKFKDRLYVKFNQRIISKSTPFDYIYYITKVMYLLWITIGLFSSSSNLFLLILMISALKFLIILKLKKFTEVYDIISSVSCIIVLIFILSKLFT